MAAKPNENLTGRETVFEKTLLGDDVAAYAKLSGDDHPIHVDEDFARRAGLPGRIVQGSLLVGLMAGASTKFFEETGIPALSYGYDRLRFTGTVRLGQTLRTSYRIEAHDRETSRTTAEVQVKDETGRLVAVAKHIAKLLPANG